MKKLMIAAAVALVGVAAQAAATTWTWTTTSAVYGVADADLLKGSGTYDADGDKLKGGATVTYTMLLAWADDGSKSYGPDTVTYSTAGAVSQKNFALSDLPEKGTWIDYTITLTYSGTDSEGYAYTATSTIADRWQVQPTGTITLKTAAPSSWTVTSANPGPIPEPTSGLLLLLGVAGLALRRKQK